MEQSFEWGWYILINEADPLLYLLDDSFKFNCGYECLVILRWYQKRSTKILIQPPDLVNFLKPCYFVIRNFSKLLSQFLYRKKFCPLCKPSFKFNEVHSRRFKKVNTPHQMQINQVWFCMKFPIKIMQIRILFRKRFKICYLHKISDNLFFTDVWTRWKQNDSSHLEWDAFIVKICISIESAI